MHSVIRKSLISAATVITSLFAGASVAVAGVHVTGSGSFAKNHLGLETHDSTSLKGSIAFDIGPYLRLGYTYTDKTEHREGYLNDADDVNADPVYVYFKQDIYQQSHSVDLFAILYNGQIFTPYIFGGMGVRKYTIILDREDKPRTKDQGSSPYPSFGAGLGIALSKNFSLKVSNTWSIGQIQDLEGNAKTVRDSQLDVGLTFSFL